MSLCLMFEHEGRGFRSAAAGEPAAMRRSEREAGSLRALRRSATDAPNNGSQSKLGDTDFGDH